MLDLSDMQVLVCRYDYSGYGQSSGKVRPLELYRYITRNIVQESCVHKIPVVQPSEQNTYADIEAAYKCLEESYGTKQEDVILYGQSVGSGPTLDLATRLPKLRAVILHSPILSGLRVMYPVKRTYWFDIYKVKYIFFTKSILYVFLNCIFLSEKCNLFSFIAEH